MIWFFTGPFLYLTTAVFVVTAAAKVVYLARLPRHLRWELYPVPGQGKEGSKYQHVDFATQPKRISHFRELVYMGKEILALKKVFSGRRDLWVGSMLLHAGLYLGILLVAVLAASACSMALRLSPIDPGGGVLSPPQGLFALLISGLGVGGFACGLAGSIYLAMLRLADRGLRDMSDRVTFFNLGLLAAVFVSGLLAWRVDPAFVAARQHIASLLRGSPGVVQSSSLAAAMVLVGLFAAYLPFSRMFHAAAKYFFYHAILWDLETMRPGSRIERDFTAYLAQRVSWSAAHIRQNQTWVEQLGGSQDAQAGGPPHDA